MKALIVLLLSMVSTTILAVEPRLIGPAVVYTAEGDFDQVKQDLLLAIGGRGMVISYTSHASSMLDRTAGAVGKGVKKVYDKAEIVLFCKADLSYDLVAANPHNIVLCPYAISVYTLAGELDRVYLSIRQPYKDDAAYAPIHKMLMDIINETIQG